jgi:hypothetical protein
VVDVVRARRIAAIAVLLLAPGCSREPGDQEVAARKARERAIVEASQEEERRKDRARMAAASAAAAAETEAIRAPATSLAAGEPAKPPTITMLDKVHPVQTTEEQVVAQATARVEMALANPPSMLVRNPQLREQNTVVCLEANSRDATGSYTGFVPVIVTPRQVFFRKRIGESRDVADVSASLDFDRLNERYRCW